MQRSAVVVCAAVIAVGLTAPAVRAQQPKIDDPIPPGAKGTVLSISGEVRPIEGLVSQVAGRTESLAAALTALNAQTTATEIRIAMSADVLFDFNKADIKKDAEPSLTHVVTVLTSYPQAAVTIEGYTDAKGSDAYNQRLSEQRAEAVRAWLAAQRGLAGIQFTTRGFGAAHPVAPNRKPDGSDDPLGRQKNRRVEIVVRQGR
jgi:outer membrane protein OmpA-like peptidoglycan-associated protein